jgi:hypothetical protein
VAPFWRFGDKNSQLTTPGVATVNENTNGVTFAFRRLADSVLLLDAQGAFFWKF